MKSGVLFTFTVCTAVAISANFQYGFSSTYLNTPVDQFKIYINESFTKWHKPLNSTSLDLVWNLISNIWFVGFFIGIWFSPVLNDRFGRKVGFIVGNTLSLLASVLRALAIISWQPELLFLGRLLASICTAVTYQANILYLQECSPTYMRGIASFLSEICYAFMTVVGMFLGTDQLLGKHLFWLLAFAVIPSMLALLVLFFLHETPKFLMIVRGNREQAEASVRFYHGEDTNVDQVLKEIEMEAESEQDELSSLRDAKEIFKEYHLRKALLLSCAALQNTVALWSILLNSTDFLQRANVHDWNDNLSKWVSTAMVVAYAIATLIGCVLVERVGRRPLLLTFSALNISSIVLFTLFDRLQLVADGFKYGCVFALLFYGFSYGAAVGPVSWFISSELVPQKYRSLVQSLCYAINTVMVVITTFTVVPLYNAIGSYSFLIMYTAPSLVCMYYLIKCLPETTGREIHEIVDDLKRR